MFFIVVLGALLSCSVNVARDVTIDAQKVSTLKNVKSQRILILDVSTSKYKIKGMVEMITMNFLEYGYNVIEQTYATDVMREENIKITSGKDIQQIKKIGQAVHAGKVLIASITEFTKGQHLAPGGCISSPSIETYVHLGMMAKLFDVKTGDVVWTGIASTQDTDQYKCIKRISEEFASRLED